MTIAQKIELTVKGMTCQGCVNAVTRVIKRVDSAATVKIDLASGRVEALTSAPGDDLAKAINTGGYEATARHESI
jgi:copper chaperone